MLLADLSVGRAHGRQAADAAFGTQWNLFTVATPVLRPSCQLVMVTYFRDAPLQPDEVIVGPPTLFELTTRGCPIFAA
eukprot:7669701-Heterocapsa_arctica.AAC.1